MRSFIHYINPNFLEYFAMVYILFGVSGSGKTLIGNLLAKELMLPFHDADDFHPESNIKKMSSGLPLNDDDRIPWLETLALKIQQWNIETGAVLACSALKKNYRELLSKYSTSVQFIFLKVPETIAFKRLEQRKGHYMPKSLLDSQFETLEEPTSKDVISITVNKNPSEVLKNILEKIRTNQNDQQNMLLTNIGIYGLGVMGSNLALNFEEKGYRVSLYNPTLPDQKNLLNAFFHKNRNKRGFEGYTSLERFVQSIQLPRKILIMIKSGDPVDQAIDQLSTYLDEGDILIDGGNSHFSDTSRRIEKLKLKRIHFIGMGISGGEHGARCGPSLMPGGDSTVWKCIKPLLTSIAAKAPNGDPCCKWIGNDSAGHFVKMIHNGIEYADMQLIAEAYHFMKSGLDMNADAISDIFQTWNKGTLHSYLLSITVDILATKEDDGTHLIEYILDSAGQKGTGKWMAINALEEGIPIPVISEAIFARFVSSFKSLRKEASDNLEGPNFSITKNTNLILKALEQALLASRIMALAEGFFLMKNVSDKLKWDIKPELVSKTWQGGCIIQSSLLNIITECFVKNNKLQHLLLAPELSDKLKELQSGWRTTISTSVQAGIPMPVLTAALNQYDSIRSEQLPANLLQAQRDFFGSHRYERTDSPRGVFFHTDWQKLKRKTGY